MSAIGPNYAQHQGVSAVSGSWANPTNAEGSGTGAYTTWTSTTSSATATLELMAYDVVNLPAGAVLDSIVCECQHHESSTTVISALTGQLFTTSSTVEANTAEFESTVGDWAGVSSTLTRDATHVNSGSWAAKLVGTGMQTSGFTRLGKEGSIPVTSSAQANAGLWVFTTAAGQTATLAFSDFYNSAGTGLGAGASGASTALTQNAWTFVQVGHAAGSTAVTTNLTLTFGASGTFWVDTVSCGTPAAVGSPTAFTRATADRIDTITATTGINAADIEHLRLRVVASHNATTTSGVESIDFARITANYHMPVSVLPGNEFGEADQSVEFGTLNWVAGTNTTSAARSNVQAFDGQQSVNMVSTASGSMGLVWNGAKLAVTAGSTYTFAAEVWSPVSTTCNMEVDWYNGATFVNFMDLTGSLVSLVPGWNSVGVTGVAPATTNGAVPIVIPIATTAAQTFYADQFFFGLPTAVSDSDTSSGADTESVAILGTTVSDSDTSSGTDGGESITATLADSDTSSGTESQTIAVTVAGADASGTAVDTETFAPSVSDADTGAGTEASSTIAATLADADTSTGTESQTIVATLSGGSDSGSGADSGSAADVSAAMAVVQIQDASSQNVFGILQCDITSTDGSALVCVVAANVNYQSWTVSQVWDSRGNMWQQAVSSVASDWAQNTTWETPPYPAISIWYAPYSLGVEAVSVSMANLTSECAMAMRVYEITGISNLTPVDVATVAGNLLPSGAGADVISGGISTATNNTLVIAGMAVADFQPVTFDSGSSGTFTGSSVVALDGTSGVYNADLTFDAVHRTAATVGSYTCLWDNVVAEAWVSASVSFNNGLNNTANLNPYWPQLISRIAFGEVPNDQQLGPVSYTGGATADVSVYVLQESITYGLPYELGTPEAGECSFYLYNQDGRFDPLNDASPYAPNVLDFVPFRQHALWSGRDYGVFTGYVEQWPQVYDDSNLNTSQPSAIDALGVMARCKLKSCMQEEVLYDQPWGYWPLADNANAAYATNIGTGPGAYNALAPFPPRGAGNGAAGFGVGTALAGDTATGWGQTNDTPANDQGWNLVLTTQDPVNGMQIVPSDTSTLEGSGAVPWTSAIFLPNYTLARSTAQHHSGTQSLGVTITAGGAGSPINIQPVTPVAGERGQYYVFQSWFRAPTTSCTARIDLVFVDDHGNQYDITSSTNTAMTSGAWTSVSVRFFMPSTATNVYSILPRLVLNGATTTVGMVWYVDDVTCTQQSGVMPSANIYPGAITAECWAAFDSVPGKLSPSAILTLMDSTGVYLATLQVSQQLPGNTRNPILELTELNSSSAYIITPSSANARGFGDSRWHHYVMTMTSAGSTVWVDGIEYISTTTVPANTDPQILMVGGIQSNKHDPLNMGIGNYAHAALYSGSLPPVRISNHFRSGHDAFPEDTGSRINRVLGYASYSGPRALDMGSSTLAGCYSTSGQFASDSFTDCLTWEYGMGWVNGQGALRFQNRVNRFTGTTLGVFGDGNNEFHYTGAATYPDDPTYQYNDIEISREGPTLSQGVTFSSGDPNNTIPQYFTSTLQQTLALLSDDAIVERVAFLYALLSVAVVRADTIVITPSADPSLWPVALGAQVGGRYTIRRRPMRPGQAVMEFDVIISSIQHSVAAGSWVTTFTTLPAVLPGTVADGTVWRLDDPDLSILGTNTRPGW